MLSERRSGLADTGRRHWKGKWMPTETHEFDKFWGPESVPAAELVADNLRLRHALTFALADYELLNRCLEVFNIPMHPFTLTPQLIRHALEGTPVGDDLDVSKP
jgi:hypothetical protein